ncbi:MAG TPA: hypothetical protein P5267_02480, partial [Patescibacteria group bacterium]|nr:hypothetical protein [Patescibacteria group bacterium]
MREKPTQEFDPEEASASFAEREAKLPTGDRVKKLIILLTTLFAFHGSAEARKPSAHEELMSMLPKFNPAEFNPKVGPSPEQAAKTILALREQTASVLETFGGEAAWAEHNLVIDGSRVNDQQVANSLPSDGSPVFVFGSRQLEGGHGSLSQEIKAPS